MDNTMESNTQNSVDNFPKGSISRPSVQVKLRAIYKGREVLVRNHDDCTSDLTLLPKGIRDDSISKYYDGKDVGYIIYCDDTQETWFAHNLVCLNMNFIYREDLSIDEVHSEEEFLKSYHRFNDNLMAGLSTRKVCYILDTPGAETYEVYYKTSYPVEAYGKPTPLGSFVYKYKNRFHRDIAILRLDKKYSSSSKEAASEFVSRKLGDNQAIIVSDGSCIDNVCTSTFFYIDSEDMRKESVIHVPSDITQGVNISEIIGAYNALNRCRDMGKNDVVYYYDSSFIVGVFNNKANDSIPEIKKYKELIQTLIDEDFNVNFVEIHTKTGENRDKENKALMFLHNSCDAECRSLLDTFGKDFRKNALSGSREGKSIKDVSAGSKKYKKCNKGYKGSGRKNERKDA